MNYLFFEDVPPSCASRVAGCVLGCGTWDGCVRCLDRSASRVPFVFSCVRTHEAGVGAVTQRVFHGFFVYSRLAWYEQP